MPSPTPPLSVVEAAAKSGYPKRTVQHAIAKGDLKAHKMTGATGAYLIYPAELDKWIARREARASA